MCVVSDVVISQHVSCESTQKRLACVEFEEVSLSQLILNFNLESSPLKICTILVSTVKTAQTAEAQDIGCRCV